jgi:hypothetical protein
VSKARRESYKKVANVQIAGLTRDYDEEALLFIITSETTLFSAVFASVSRLRLAFHCDLTVDNGPGITALSWWGG